MQHQRIRRKIRRERAAGGEFEGEFLAGVFPNPCRKLDGADVAALAVVRTALADENRIAVGQRVERIRAAKSCVEYALIPLHENGKRREKHVFRHDLFDIAEHLTVGDDGFGRRFPAK